MEVTYSQQVTEFAELQQQQITNEYQNDLKESDGDDDGDDEDKNEDNNIL